jgi:FlaA1/EpsC-like NDP-sugar epimerase
MLDILLINTATYFALILRFEGIIPYNLIDAFVNTFFLTTLFKVFIYKHFDLYKSIWSYASIDEMVNIVVAVLFGTIAEFLYGNLVNVIMPRSVYAVSLLLTLFFIGGIRMSLRMSRRYIGNSNGTVSPKIKAMIYGAGFAGAMLLKEMKTNGLMCYLPIVFVDDDRKKHGSKIFGIPVEGGKNDVKRLTEKYGIQEIILAIPSASGKERSEILSICKETKCKLKIYSAVGVTEEDNASIKRLRNADIEDLLGREEVKLNTDEVSEYLKGETVLVTGGGGSIGSELCRQIAKYEPQKLIILDIYENNAYELQNDLLHIYGNKLNFEVIIASITDEQRIEVVFSKHKPTVVFHAAAHKHVPLMESNVCEAVTNNIFGTLNVARFADIYGAKSFVLVSSDKAVNPTSVMGATKRAAEIVVQSMDNISNTEFVGVRFGNVLGSNGSVVPLFEKQISRGGPVTITHPDVTRYFMSIREAVQLIIQAGAMAQGGEIFVLDMGDSIKIDKLARDMIKLAGLKPDVDIKIGYTGLRPGEKLYEELLLNGEGTKKTHHEKIFIAKSFDLNYENVFAKVQELITTNDEDEARERLHEIVKNGSCAVGNEMARVG